MANLVIVSKAAKNSRYSARHIRYLLQNNFVKGENIGVWLVDADDLKRYEAEMKELGTKKHNPTKNKPEK